MLTLAGYAQYPITSINITMPANPPANTSDWATAMPPVMITAQAQMRNGQVPGDVQECKILVTIKQGGSKKYGTFTPDNAPSAGFTTAVKNWSGSNATTLLGNSATLPPGTYELCVQFFTYNTPAKPLSNEVCKTFTIQGSKEESYTPPVNIIPADKKIFTENEIKAPITFRWTPLCCRPSNPPDYRLNVWQVGEGKNAAQVMQTEKPLISEMIKAQTQFTYRKGWDGKGNYVWRVEAIDGQGKVLGTSEATTFSVGSPCSPDYEMLFDSVYCGQDGKVHVQGHIKITPKPTVTVNSISLIQIKETNFSGADVPASIILPKNLTASGNSYPFSFIINGNMCDKELYIGYNINFTCSTTGQSINLPCGDSKKNIPCCRCTTCDNIDFTLGQETAQFKPWGSKPWWFSDNNYLYLTQPIVVGPPSIKVLQVKAEVVDFYWYVEGDCKKCNSNDYYWGNLITGNTNNTGFNPTGTSGTDDAGIPLPNSHEMDFISNSTSGATFNGNINLQLSLPPQTVLSCCKDCFRYCIRYTIVFKENGVCKTCTKVKCYEVKRQHRQSDIIMWPPLNDCGERPVINHGGGGVLLDNGVKNN